MRSIFLTLLKISRSTIFCCLVAIGLAGCASIQIDVDVYKGPLINDPDIQTQQYASLAIAHYPIIVELQKDAEVKIAECDRNPDPASKKSCDVQRFAYKFISCHVLPLYEDRGGSNNDSCSRDDSTSPSSDSDGIRSLAKKLVGKSSSKDVKNNLNQALVFFAQQILIVADNQTMFEGDNKMAAHRAILQSLGNTIIVHANDLQRQDSREERLRDRAQAERLAIGRTFTVTPPDAYQQIVQAVKLRAIANKPSSPSVTSDEKPLTASGISSLNQI